MSGDQGYRSIEVRKLRGADFRSGKHTYRICESGLVVYPRLTDPGDQPDQDRGTTGDQDRLSSGIQALDDMLADGYRRGAAPGGGGARRGRPPPGGRRGGGGGAVPPGAAGRRGGPGPPPRRGCRSRACLE
jgi:hypothetical protein